MWLVATSVNNLYITYASQRRHRLAHSSASSSLRFRLIECLSSAFSPRTASCSLEVRSFFIVYFLRLNVVLNPYQDFEISEDTWSTYSSPWCDLYRSVCPSRSPLFLRPGLSTFSIGLHLPRPRSYCRWKITRRGGYCLWNLKSFKKSMWVLTSEIEFLFTLLYHRRAKKQCSFKTQTPTLTIISLYVTESIDWFWDSSNAWIPRNQSIWLIPHQWLWTGFKMQMTVRLFAQW